MMHFLVESRAEQGSLRRTWLLRCGAGLAASLFALSALSAAEATSNPGAAGIAGVAAADAVAPVSSAVIERGAAQSPASSAQHERGYQFDLESARRMPKLPGAGPTQLNVSPPPLSAKSSTEPEAFAPALGTNFDGIGDTGVIPADPNLAVGTQSIIQVVNSSIRITDRNGGGSQTSTLAALMGSPAGSSGLTFDPRVQYDHFANRFVVLALKTNSASTDSWYLVSVSKTATPTTAPSSWFTYHLRSDIDFPSTNTANWSDYAPIGFDDTYFYITSNQFFFNTSTRKNVFQYSKIRKYPKSSFYSGGSVSGVEWIQVRDVSNNLVFTIQPAVTFGVPGHEWLAAASSGSGNALAVFRITGNSLFRFSVPVGSTALPNQARQKNSSQLIDSGDSRLLNAVVSNGRFYTCHTVKTSSFACAARYLGVNTSNISAPSSVLDRVVGNSSFDFYYPAVACNPAGNTSSALATVLNFSGPTRFAGSLYTQISPTGAIHNNSLAVLKEGGNTYGRNRWGDYNGICRDPTNSNSFWFNAMYARSTVNTWGTYVGSTTLTASAAPTGVKATYDPDSGLLTLTGDETANHVLVSRDKSGVRVTGTSGTLINGQRSVSLAVPAKFELSADLGGGNDQLTLIGLQLGKVDAKLGDGNDQLSLFLCAVDSLQTEGGDGVDVVSTTGSTIAKSALNSVP